MATRTTTPPKAKAATTSATKPVAKTVSTKTAVAKAVPKAASAKASTKTAAAEPVALKATIVESVTPVVSGMPIKKPELIERVMTETGMKKKDVKPVVEAMLTVMGRALAGGEEMTVPPLGKLMINRSKDVANAKILNLKLRHPTADKAVGGGD